MLLLVDDQKAQVAELHAFRQHRMGADHDVDGAVREPRPRRRRVLGVDEARQRPDGQRKAAEALREGLVVLACEESRRCDHRDLGAGHRGDEGRAHRHLGLAEAHVAADQPVHRRAGGQVVQHRLDRGKLVLRLLVREARRERLPRAALGLKDPALAEQPFGRDADQAVGDLADTLLQARLLGLPGAAAETVEQPLLVAVAGQQFDILDRQVKAVAAGIFEEQAFVGGAEGGDDLEALVAADAVVDMDDQVAGGQALGLGQEVLGPALAAAGADQAVAEHVLFGDHSERGAVDGAGKTPVERPDQEIRARVSELGHLAGH